MSTLSGVSYGGQVYFKNLIPALAKADKINKYVIFTRHEELKNYYVDQNNFKFILLNKIYRYQLLRIFWEQFILPFQIKNNKIDKFFTAKNLTVFFSPVKTVIAIRNMEPFFYKKYDNDYLLNIVSFIRKFLTRISMIKAHKIIVVSKFTKKYIGNNYPQIKHKLHVIYNGNPFSYNHKKNNNVNGEFILTASKFVSYANQLNLLKGYNYLNLNMKNLPPLWMAGGVHDRSYYNKVKSYIAKNKLSEKVKILGLVDHSELIELYLKATAFLFPSTLEACPHTLIEVMGCQVPMAVSNLEPMPEICNDAAIYFNPVKKEEIAESIKMLLSDNKLRAQLSKACLKQASFFDWNKSAKILVKIFDQVV